MGHAAGDGELRSDYDFQSPDLADAANDNGSIHAPWRRVVAAGIAALFTLTVVLIGLVCTVSAAEPHTSLRPASVKI
jgi:hypothetical protein